MTSLRGVAHLRKAVRPDVNRNNESGNEETPTSKQKPQKTGDCGELYSSSDTLDNEESLHSTLEDDL